jgi:hypothetical protein
MKVVKLTQTKVTPIQDGILINSGGIGSSTDIQKSTYGK